MKLLETALLVNDHMTLILVPEKHPCLVSLKFDGAFSSRQLQG